MHYYRDELRETPRQQALRELREAEEAERLTLPKLIGLTLFVLVFVWVPLLWAFPLLVGAMK